MSLTQTTDNGGGAIQIIPLALVGGLLDDTVGTVIDLQVIGDIDFQYPMTTSETSEERNEVQLINGVTLSTPKVTKVIDKQGADVAGSGGNSDAYQIVFNVYEQDYAFLTSMIAIKSVPVLVWAPLGLTNAAGFGWILGYLDGTLSAKRSGNTHNAVQLTVKGASFSLDTGVTAASLATNTQAAISAITQVGYADSAYDLDPSAKVTPTTGTEGWVDAGDFVTDGLLGGKIVFKQGT